MSFACNYQISARTGEYLGNYVEDGSVVKHLSKDSFLMWLHKKDPSLTMNDTWTDKVINGLHDRSFGFQYDGKTHTLCREG